MTTTPKISVIVPVYKAEKYLQQCVDSLLGQTLRDIEIILVDDGSPDGCPAICDDYARQDARVRVIHKENGGLLRARITGVEAAKAPYVGFVDDDDYAAPDMFETLWQAAVEHRAQMVCCSFWIFSDGEPQEAFRWSFPPGLFSGKRLIEEFYPQWFESRKEGRMGLVKAVWCKLFDRSLLEEVYTHVPRDVTLFEDMVVTFAVTALAERIVTLPDAPLYHYRVVQGSMLHSYWRNYYRNMMDVLASLARMPRRQEADPFIREGVELCRAYALYDILTNECHPGRTSTPKERAAILAAFFHDPAWRRAAQLDVLPADAQTSRLFRQLLLHGHPRLLRAGIWFAMFKNKLLQVIHDGR